MSSRYKFSNEEIEKIKNARANNKNKRVEARLKALLLRAEGKTSKYIAEKVDFHPDYIPKLVKKYREEGIEAITGNHYKANRKNMTYEEEEEILSQFEEKANKGQMIVVSEIKAAYEEKVGHSIGGSQIYYVLKRHGWRKVMPRSKHPKKANDEEIETSKKLIKKSGKWQKVAEKLD